MRRLPAIWRRAALALAALLATTGVASAQVTIDLGDDARLELSDRGALTALVFSDGERWEWSKYPNLALPSNFVLESKDGNRTPSSVKQRGDRLIVEFDDGSVAVFELKRGPGMVLFRLVELDVKGDVDRFRMFRVIAPNDAKIGHTLNAAYGEKWTAAVMTAAPNTRSFIEGGHSLNVATHKAHGLSPAVFGVVVAPTADFMAAVERFEPFAGIPSPRFNGAWNKTSPDVKRSYLFLTRFSESQFDEALAIAKRGGFDRILFGQESWSKGTGHYDINTDRFPDGLKGLARTFEKFREAGFKPGLHFLGPSIYPPDSYLTPVPDPRLVLGAKAKLAADIDEKADFIPLEIAPEDFPEEDGGYNGAGTILRIGDELIAYGERSMEAPFGFINCRRGHLNTKPTAHKKGDQVAHLVRAYGYHMYDMDTSILDEIAGNFAKVADAVGAEMIYFDGSERLQGDHWYYNAKLHKAFRDHLKNKDTFLQASSYSPYSWHLLARSASADGHGDLKGYLDQRSPWFTSMGRDGMPLDIGWYYGYDPKSTLDQYEYVLAATIGYDSSMSFQVSVDAAQKHPFTEDILNLIAKYEKLRLSGRVDQAMRDRLRIDPSLGGGEPPSETDGRLERRREYRLLGDEGSEVFQRVLYQPWRELDSAEKAAESWTVEVKGDDPAKVGFWVHAEAGSWLAPGPSYYADDALTMETWDDRDRYPGGDKSAPGTNAVSPGVEQTLEFKDDDPREGESYAVYTAKSARSDNGGWSAIGRTYDEPLDLSEYKGFGLWIRGDGQGGSFKLQIRDKTGALDYYIVNNYEGWRYQQLARPDEDPIDFADVRSLTIYYNGLPGETTISCGVDDVKALRTLDEPGVTDPWVEVDGQRLEWKGTLEAGQYLVWWPGEPAGRFGPPLKSPERGSEPTKSATLQPGEHKVRFGSNGPLAVPARVRLTLQPPERHAVGE